MTKLAVWTFALCTVLLPLGRAHAKPRVEPSHAATRSASSSETRKSATSASQATTSDAPSRKVAKKAKRVAKAKAPCFSPEVHLARRRGDILEHRQLALTFCDGSPNPAALDSVSVLARPRDAERPLMPEIRAYQRRSVDRGPLSKRKQPEYLSEHVMRVHPDLLKRLQQVALRFPGKTIEVVSGHRPDARDTSRHHHGRALDLRVDGVSREALRDFLRTIDETGVGYYPNSYFVHMDVRDKRGFWVDRSAPGESADYGTWPPSKREIERVTDEVLAGAMRDLATLGERNADVDDTDVSAQPEREIHEEPSADALTRDDVARIRAEVLNAVEAL